MKKAAFLSFLFFLLSACNPISENSSSIVPTNSVREKTSAYQITTTPTPFLPLSTPSRTPTSVVASPTQTPLSPTQVGSPLLLPNEWQTWPIIPTLSARSLEIYKQGLSLGNNPQAFSKFGDCETDTGWYLTSFDKSTAYYNLGPYEQELTEVIQYFTGSFKRESVGAQDGGSAATLLNPMWADPDLCNSGETPLDCEIRLHKPSFAIISVGTNDAVRKDRFEGNMRKIIERLIELGVVPILSTKADNLEGDNSINLTISQLAIDYDIPVWNFWAAVQPLPNQGLLEDGAHLTWAFNDFSNPENLEKAWPIRNLTALRVLDSMRQSVLGLK